MSKALGLYLILCVVRTDKLMKLEVTILSAFYFSLSLSLSVVKLML